MQLDGQQASSPSKPDTQSPNAYLQMTPTQLELIACLCLQMDKQQSASGFGGIKVSLASNFSPLPGGHACAKMLREQAFGDAHLSWH